MGVEDVSADRTAVRVPQTRPNRTRVVIAAFGIIAAAVIAVLIARDVAAPPSASSPPSAGYVAISTAPTYDGAAYAKQVADAVLSSLTTYEGRPPATFAEMCQTPVSWACAIARIESESPGAIKVTLQPERVWISKTTDRDWYKFGEHVALGIYNFAEAAGETTPSGWRKALTALPHRVDVYQSNGELAYASPLSFPGR